MARRNRLNRVLCHHFERFVAEYEGRFEKEHGYFRPIIKEVVERYPDYGNPLSGFARIRCPDCVALAATDLLGRREEFLTSPC